MLTLIPSTSTSEHPSSWIYNGCVSITPSEKVQVGPGNELSMYAYGFTTSHLLTPTESGKHLQWQGSRALGCGDFTCILNLIVSHCSVLLNDS